MATAIPKIVSASWFKDAVKCPHCKRSPNIQLRQSLFEDGEGMVIGCGGGLDECVRIPIRDLEPTRINADAEKLYKKRFEMARILVGAWNERHTENPEYLEGHA